MGGGIAADLANAGWTVHLLDQTVALAEAGKRRVEQSSPPLLYVPELAGRIVPGCAEELSVCAAADWVIEAIAEKLVLKQALLSRLESAVGPENLSPATPAASRSRRCQSTAGWHFGCASLGRTSSTRRVI